MKQHISRGGALALAVIVACQSDPFATREAFRIEFSEGAYALGTGRSATVGLMNTGEMAVGPIEIRPAAVRDGGGAIVPGWSVTSDPSVVATLNPSGMATLELQVQAGGTLQPGLYKAVIKATTPGAGAAVEATLDLSFDILVSETPAASVTIEAAPAALRQGDVVGLEAVARDEDGNGIEGATLSWSVLPAAAGFITGNGRFVGYAPGEATLIARAGGASDTVAFPIEERALSGGLARVGSGPELDRFTSDLWVHGGYAYLGTWSVRSSSGTPLFGNTLFTWDVRNPALPVRTDALAIDARTVNDVKVHPDGGLAVITHEGSGDGLNGVTLLDLSDPAHPSPISRFTTGLEPGIHNVWLDGEYAYLVVDGVGSGLRVMDISDPSAPRVVADYWAGESFLHDVYVRDGLAFLSHWNAGLAILDVGHGLAGGSPESPVEVSVLPDLDGQTHNAWYWPENGYVFLGEEDFGTPGHMRVVDASDLRDPRLVATFAVAGEPPHNYWLDEDAEILYLAWYGEGIRALDVSGELLGDLSRQGREILGLRYDGGDGGCGSPTCTWAPQLEGGLLYLADRNAGLVILRPDF